MVKKTQNQLEKELEKLRKEHRKIQERMEKKEKAIVDKMFPVFRKKRKAE